jgi:RHS repeat-associated protein
MTVSGSLATNASYVTVNNVGATVYQDYTFSTTGGVPLNDGANTLTTKAVDGQNFTNTLVTTASLPRSVSLTYDSNGNLINDGLRRLEYDSADRLTAVYVPNSWRTEFVYDGLSRRRVTREKGWQGGTWVQTNETRYVYLGRSVVQERNSAGNPTVTYTRGLDLSGTFGGAGGIGGLLARTDGSGAAFYHNDGAGNITTLINSSGQVQARYTYDPFGNLIDKRGPLADANLYRFSSKEHLPSAGLYYYGFRFYEPNLQRWLNKDPIGLAGGLNLYQFVGNNPISLLDPFGLAVAYNSDAETLSGVLIQGVPGPLPYIKSEGWGLDRWFDYPVGLINNALSTAGNTLILLDQAAEDGLTGLFRGDRQLAQAATRLLGVTPWGRLGRSCKAAKTGTTLADDLAAAATRARNTVGSGSGGAYGTRVHTAFEAEVQGLNQGLSTEISYLNGREVLRGTPGSVRLDVVNGPRDAPISIFDLKTGGAQLTPARIQQIQSHVPGGANVPVLEVRP